jgi:dTDP-4-amino-4,6-dideoxygalactose transaminase
VDCDPASYLMDTDAALAAVTSATGAIVPVHLYGQLAAVERLAGAGVPVVEDAAQSQGATRLGAGAGSGGIAATSFYPGKNLGAYGDAGAVVSVRADWAQQVRLLANHGSRSRYAHEVVGFNSRLDALQAVVLRAKLARLGAANEARRAAARRYHELLAPLDVVRPVALPGNRHVWHLYAVRIPGDTSPERRNRVLGRLHQAGIGAGVHYPVPVHLTRAFADLGYRVGAFPHAEAAAAQLLSLPLYPQLTAEKQETVVRVLADALERT